jgi:hypothetical protein
MFGIRGYSLNIPLRATVHTGPPVAAGGKTPHPNRTLGIQIGSTCCALTCPDDEIYQSLNRLYRNFLTEQDADVTIDLERGAGYAGNTSGDDLPGDETRGLTVLCDEPDLFVAEMECNLDESGNGFRYMNRLFFMAYYTACLEKYGGNLPAMLVHACGVLRSGRAVIFTGPSESGKTTIAGLCGEKDGRVISDEMVLVTRPGPDGGVCVQSVPIIGGSVPGINITVPLRYILLLKRGETTRIRPVEPVDAYLRLISQTITPCYLGQRETEPVLPLLADFSQETVRAVPVYELEFALNGESPWREIGNLEEMLYDKVVK